MHQISVATPFSLGPQPALQPVVQRSVGPLIPIDSVVLPQSSSPPALLRFSANPNEPSAVSNASRLASLPPDSSLPAVPSQSLHQRRQTSYWQSSAEGELSSTDSQASSEFNPSRSLFSTISAHNNFSLEQEELHSGFTAAVDEALRSTPPVTVASAAPAPVSASVPTSVKLQQACLQLCIALLDHKLNGKVADSIVVGFLAVNDIDQERTGFEEAVTATSPLSGLVKLAQLLVIQHALWEHKAGRATYPGDIVAELQDRFMTFGSNSPMNLILNLRSYGAVVRNNTTAAGFINGQRMEKTSATRGCSLI